MIENTISGGVMIWPRQIPKIVIFFFTILIAKWTYNKWEYENSNTRKKEHFDKTGWKKQQATLEKYARDILEQRLAK